MADFEIIAEGTLTGTSNTIDFTAIPQTFTHLQIQFSARSAKAGANSDGGEIKVNGDTGTTYGVQSGYTSEDGSANGGAGNLNMGTRSQIDSAIRVSNAGMSTGVHAVNKILIPNYTSTTVATKGLLFEATAAGQSTTWWIGFGIGFWGSTAAITQVTLYSESVSYPFLAGCSYWLAGWA